MKTKILVDGITVELTTQSPLTIEQLLAMTSPNKRIITWIDATKELPDDDLSVIVLTDFLDIIRNAVHTAGAWHTEHDGQPILGVTHWCDDPMPPIPTSHENH